MKQGSETCVLRDRRSRALYPRSHFDKSAGASGAIDNATRAVRARRRPRANSGRELGRGRSRLARSAVCSYPLRRLCSYSPLKNNRKPLDRCRCRCHATASLGEDSRATHCRFLRDSMVWRRHLSVGVGVFAQCAFGARIMSSTFTRTRSHPSAIPGKTVADTSSCETLPILGCSHTSRGIVR